jgi:uracil phosphoribosyltransferase
VSKIKLVTFVASPEGIKAFEEEHPDVDVVTCAIDEGLGMSKPSSQNTT